LTRAVVFAYHDVGVRCLNALLAAGVEIALVVSHRDDPAENIWFGSVAALAASHRIKCVFPEDPNTPEFIGQISSIAPDFIFSFYYRRMLSPAILACAPRGAFNMHGSLLPKYRGRAPVNWAILHGETETGASLHEMVAKPDAGRLVDQEAVPIGPDDTATEVFARVTVAAEIVMRRALPGLLDGTAVLKAQDLASGSYFGGRKPADGRILWQQGASAVHNLVRAVAPPYPGAFTALKDVPLRILKTRVLDERIATSAAPALWVKPGGGQLVGICADGSAVVVLEAELDGAPFNASAFLSRFGPDPIPLPVS